MFRAWITDLSGTTPCCFTPDLPVFLPAIGSGRLPGLTFTYAVLLTLLACAPALIGGALWQK